MSNLVRSNDLSSLRSMMEDVWNNKFFNVPFFNTDFPAVNVLEKDDHYELEVSAPGYNKKDFKVMADNGMLTISAENSSEKKEESENYTRREFSRSSFTRSFTLPENVAGEDIKAKYQDGLLRIDLKKTAKSLPKGKEVKVD